MTGTTSTTSPAEAYAAALPIHAVEEHDLTGLDRVGVLHLHDPEHARDLREVTGTGGALEELFRMKEEGSGVWLTDAPRRARSRR